MSEKTLKAQATIAAKSKIKNYKRKVLVKVHGVFPSRCSI